MYLDIDAVHQNKVIRYHKKIDSNLQSFVIIQKCKIFSRMLNVSFILTKSQIQTLYIHILHDD